MTVISRMTSNLGIKIRNMPPLQDTMVARLRQVVDSALPPTITPRTISEVMSQWQPQTPRLLQLYVSEWYDGMSSDELPASCIQFSL